MFLELESKVEIVCSFVHFTEIHHFHCEVVNEFARSAPLFSNQKPELPNSCKLTNLWQLGKKQNMFSFEFTAAIWYWIQINSGVKIPYNPALLHASWQICDNWERSKICFHLNSQLQSDIEYKWTQESKYLTTLPCLSQTSCKVSTAWQLPVCTASDLSRGVTKPRTCPRGLMRLRPAGKSQARACRKEMGWKVGLLLGSIMINWQGQWDTGSLAHCWGSPCKLLASTSMSQIVVLCIMIAPCPSLWHSAIATWVAVTGIHD